MSTPAIQLAFKLAKQPDEIKVLPETPLPRGITELLRLCSSNKHLKIFSEKNNLNPSTTKKALLNFVENFLVREENPQEKILGLKPHYTADSLKLHYQLLMKIFHPDLSNSSQASSKTALLSKTYKDLKTQSEEPVELKNIKLSRVPPKSFYHATQKAEQHQSGVKNTVIAFSVMCLISLGIITSYLLNSSRSELVASNISTARLITEKTPVSNINSPNEKFSLSKANFADITETELANSILQRMLRDIESYYEKGDVEKIKPILANTPQMKSQTDEQMQMKLETLFSITQDRKMLLYSFKWQHISGKVHGIGKFISRYQMTGENTWQTREGIAILTVEEIQNRPSVTSLTLENKVIE